MKKTLLLLIATIMLFGCTRYKDGEPVNKEPEETKEETEVKEEPKDEPKEVEEESEEKPLSTEEWIRKKSKSVLDVKQNDDRIYIDIDGESGWSIASSVKDAFNTFLWMETILEDESINRVTFQYMYTFTDGEKNLGYSYAYERDAYKEKYETVYENGDVEPYLVFENATEYDFHPDVWNEAPEDLREGLNNDPTKIEMIEE